MSEADEIFLLFEFLLADSKIRVDAEAKPISFEMLPGDGTLYRFDPRSRGALFKKNDYDDVALRIRCAPDLIYRVLTDASFYLQENDPFDFRGDLGQLSVLARAIGGKKSWLAMRVQESRRANG